MGASASGGEAPALSVGKITYVDAASIVLCLHGLCVDWLGAHYGAIAHSRVD